MKYLFFIIAVPFLVFNQNDQKAKNPIMEILKEVKKENFKLEQLHSILKENYCSKIWVETDEVLECKLAKSISKKLKAKKINATTVPLKLGAKSISLVFLGYGKKDKKAKIKLNQEFKTLANELRNEFTFVNKTFHKGGESPEREEQIFSNGFGTTIQLVKLFGGCFGDKSIILSIFREKT